MNHKNKKRKHKFCKPIRRFYGCTKNIQVVSLFLLSFNTFASFNSCEEKIHQFLKNTSSQEDSVQAKSSTNLGTLKYKTVQSTKAIYSMSDIHENLPYFLELLCHAGVQIEKDTLLIPDDRLFIIHGDLFDSKKKSSNTESLSQVLQLSSLLLEHNPEKVYFIIGNHELFNIALYNIFKSLNPSSISLNALPLQDKTFAAQFMNIDNDESLKKRLAIIKKFLPFLKKFSTGLTVTRENSDKNIFLHAGLSKSSPVNKNDTSDFTKNYTSIDSLEINLDELKNISSIISQYPHFTNKLYDPNNFQIRESDFQWDTIKSIVTGHCSLSNEKEANSSTIQKEKNLEGAPNLKFIMVDTGLQNVDIINSTFTLSPNFYRIISED